MEAETNQAEQVASPQAEQVEVHHGGGHQAPAGTDQASSGKWRGRKGWMPGVVVLVLIALAFGGGWLLSGNHSILAQTDQTKSVDTGGFQAVFLTNGQVYFGKLANINDKYVTIKDIFYLQVQQSLQQGSTSAANSNSQVSLAKLGNELHGPKDQMFIANDQVLFWENLKSDSKVVQAISKYQNQ